MNKSLTLIFVGEDGAAAKAAAVKIRLEKGAGAQLRSASMVGEVEPCDRVVIMPDVPDHDRTRIKAVYGDKITIPGLNLPPLPPPPVVDPLANLAADWRSRDDLKSIAASVSGGRAVENKRQAIEVIEAALKARG